MPSLCSWCVRASDHPNTPPPLPSRPLVLNPIGVPKQQEAAASRLQSALISPSCHCRTKTRIQLAFLGQTVGEFPCLQRPVHVVRDACAAVSFFVFPRRMAALPSTATGASSWLKPRTIACKFSSELPPAPPHTPGGVSALEFCGDGRHAFSLRF